MQVVGGKWQSARAAVAVALGGATTAVSSGASGDVDAGEEKEGALADARERRGLDDMVK